MRRRRLYGQHFLTSRAIASRIVEAAGIRGGDTVLELGTGRGILTPLLCRKAERVISAESDAALHREVAGRLRHENLTLLLGNGLEVDAEFDVFVSNLPYSMSRRAVEWLAATPFRRGVIMVQEEFARKVSGTGADRRAISVVWQEAFDAGDAFRVGRNNFDPPPAVDSRVVPFRKRRTIPRRIIRNLHLIFSQRRKLLRTARGARRLNGMANGEVMDIAHTM